MAESLTPKQHSAIERARSNPSLKRILFRKAVGIKWYDEFVRAEFIVPSEIPPPVPAKEAGYVSIPHWLITDYLVSVSAELADPANRGHAIRMMDLIRETTEFARMKGFGNYRVWLQFSKIVGHIPVNLITTADVENFNYWLDDPYGRGVVADSLGQHWLSSVLDHADAHARTLAESFLGVLYQVSIVKRGSGETSRNEARLRFDSWHGKKITKAIAAKAGRVLGLSAAKILKDRLRELITGLDSDKWSTIRRPAIEDHEQNRQADDVDDVLIEAFRDCLAECIQQDSAAAVPFVSAMLGDGSQLIQRVAINAIDTRYAELESIVDTLLVPRFFSSHFQHELWHLLRNHYRSFSPANRVRTQTAIESLAHTDDNEHENVAATAYTRAKWLAAIQEYDVSLSQLYGNYVQVAGAEPVHPDFSSYTSSGWVESKSPIPLEQLRTTEAPELVKLLDAYRDPGRFMEPGIEGLIKALRQAVKSEPLRYYKDLDIFVNLDLAYIYSVVEAYSDLWSEKAGLVWEEIWPRLLDFCEKLVRQEKFWNDEGAQERPNFVANRNWMVGAMARLIESGSHSDDHAFSAELIPNAEVILNLLLDRQKGVEFKLDGDAVSAAINSPRGRCLEALINLSLRACRIEKNDEKRIKVWARFEPRYTLELTRVKIPEYEFATLVVNYLPNFLYMSRDWVLRYLDVMFDGRDEQEWLCAMQAYAYVNVVYPEIYKHLKDNGHFARALDDSRLTDTVEDKIVQNIVIAFLMDIEKFEDEGGLLRLLLRRKRLSELSQLIWFFWTMRKSGEDGGVRKKAFELWPHLLTAIDTTTLDGRKLASKLCDWAGFVEVVDQTTRPLILSVASFAEEDFNSSELLESIARISEHQPNEAYEIWMKMLESASPDFPMESVRQGLENILRNGRDGVRKAKEIVSRYIAAGNDEVIDCWKSVALAHGGEIVG